MGGGSGWALLSWSNRESRLITHWAADHTHLLAGATPILALDMYEHAYHMDFGAKAAAYVDAFMQNIRWQAVRGATLPPSRRMHGPGRRTKSAARTRSLSTCAARQAMPSA
jgi:hypothetical protein